MVSGAAVIEATELAFAYEGGVRAVDGVSLALAPGEFVCAIGPNGAGKTTLLKLLAGLIDPDAGRVLSHGEPLAEVSKRERARRVAVVPQSLLALPEIRVEGFVRGGRYAHLSFWRREEPGDQRAVDRALEEADVADLRDRLLTELSGGQRQRVLVARALAQEARALLVDEPTSSLDPEHQLAVLDLLAGLADEGRAVLVVTHDLNLASQYATRIALLDAGRIAADGPTAEVLRPEVLCPVYGPDLRFGTWPVGGEERPFVLPWRGARGPG